MVGLDQFVEETLSAIIRGVSSAQEKDKNNDEKKCLINPDIMYDADGGPKGKNYATVDRNLVHMIDFDVAVTTNEGATAGGKVGVFVAVLGLGVNGEVAAHENIASRIKFQVPLALPKKDN